MTFTCTADRQTHLLSILRTELNLSSSLVKRLKWQNALFINDEPAHTDRIVYPGDRIRVEIEEHVDGFLPEAMALQILYEDEYCIAVDKPVGQLVHPSPQHNSGTLANGLLHYYLQTGTPSAIHPVTRLDRDTFGVVLLAKSAHVHAQFCSMLKNGHLQKTYHAAVYGAPQAEDGLIDLPVYKIGGGSLLRTVDPRGQQAKTQYHVLTRYANTSLLQLHPLTGRTHQLRLHCMASGFPILGDPQYCSAQSAAFSAQYPLSSQQLCAASLEFLHPITKKNVCIHSKQSVLLPEA